jgi:L-alanine-DL-glutamate epimerase-like enolase superfamily enzyme
VAWSGILRSIKIAVLADAFEVNVAPHNSKGHRERRPVVRPASAGAPIVGEAPGRRAENGSRAAEEAPGLFVDPNSVGL